LRGGVVESASEDGRGVSRKDSYQKRYLILRRRYLFSSFLLLPGLVRSQLSPIWGRGGIHRFQRKDAAAEDAYDEEKKARILREKKKLLR